MKNIKKNEQLDDEFDVECLQEDELQKIGGDNTKKGIMDEYLKGKSNPKQVTLPSLVKDHTATCLAICRFFYAHAIPFHLVKSPLFKKMIDSIVNYGKGLKLPTYNETRVILLKKEVEKYALNIG